MEDYLIVVSKSINGNRIVIAPRKTVEMWQEDGQVHPIYSSEPEKILRIHEPTKKEMEMSVEEWESIPHYYGCPLTIGEEEQDA